MIQKNNKLKQFILHNKEYEKLILRVEDICHRVDVLNSFKTLGFLNEFEIKIVDSCINHFENINVCYFSRIANSEKCFTIIYKDYDFELESLTVLFQVRYLQKFGTISHKDIIGTLLSLGVRNEFIGDITMYNGNIYFEISSDLKSFILDNVTRIKNFNVKLIIANNYIEREQLYERFKGFVKSYRLDNVVKLITKLSSQKAKDYLLAGNIKVNQIVVTNFSYVCIDSDVISIKNYGRFKLFIDSNRISKRNNFFIEYDKYI